MRPIVLTVQDSVAKGCWDCTLKRTKSVRERDGQLGQMGERKTGQFGQGGTPWMVTCPSSVGGRQRARHIELMLLCMHLPFLSFYFKI